MTAVADGQVGPGAASCFRCDGERHDAADHRLDGVVGDDRDGQRVGEGLAGRRGLRGGAGGRGEDESLALEGADVDRDVEGLAALVGGDRRSCRSPRPRAGLPGKSAMVWVGPP